jgi:dethiobiotin synthase
MKGLFITGTDTGVGKTHITAAIARLWRREGFPFALCKPVVTGSDEDTRTLALAAGKTLAEVTSPHLIFREPAAPCVAAAAEGVELSLELLVRECVSRTQEGRLPLLVEGVGGLLCPLTRDATVVELISALGLPIVVVTRRNLGTLNQTLLTVEAAQRRSLTVLGYIINETQPMSSLAERTVEQELGSRLAIPLLGTVAYGEGKEGEIAAISARDWWSLADCGIKREEDEIASQRGRGHPTCKP